MDSSIRESEGKILSWVPFAEIEESAMEQARNTASMPFVHRVALMPDVHSGYGVPNGATVAVKGGYLPYGIGYDQGCGMCAVGTGLQADDMMEDDPMIIDEILAAIRERVPVGLGATRYEKVTDSRDIFPLLVGDDSNLANEKSEEILNKLMELQTSLSMWRESLKSRYSPHWLPSQKYWDRYTHNLSRWVDIIGTLGSGNHFVELQKDIEGYLWVMIHSGSRGIGYAACDLFWDLAKKINEAYWVDLPDDRLAYIPATTDIGILFKESLEFDLDFARLNRESIMRHVLHAIWEVTQDRPQVRTKDLLDVHHNYAAYENVDGQNLIVHRKGTTRARKGETVIIPGNMQAYSIIGVGKGDKASMQSCSHGAGRTMSRKRASEMFSDAFTVEMTRITSHLDCETQIAISAPDTSKIADEAGGAYKDIDLVISRQSDLISVTHELVPLGVVKG